jgi:uncharacterized SAM-binding protein YcdF (DUF218 family)
MTLCALFLLVVIATVLAWLKWRKSSHFIYLLSLALFFGVGCGPVPATLLESLQAGYSTDVETGWDGKPAIVLLGAGTELAEGNHVEVPTLAYGRLVKAFELYLECQRRDGACLLLVTGGDAQHHGASEASVYGALLRKLGVNPAALVLEARSLNTWQNAQFSAKMLGAQRVDRVFLVSSGVHLRRASLYFEHFGIHATPVRADYVRAMTSPLPLSYNFLLMDLALHEYGGILQYHVYQQLGWNVTAERPGAL